MRRLVMAIVAGVMLGAAPRPAAPATRPAPPSAQEQAQEQDLSATRVSLRVAKAHPREVILELARQAGARVQFTPRTLFESREFADVSLDLRDVTFWHALRELTEKTGLAVQRLTPERGLVVGRAFNRQWAGYPHVEAGAFLVVAQSLQRVHAAELNGPAGIARSVNLRLSLYAEPKVRILRADPIATIDLADDELGNSLLPPPDAAVAAVARRTSVVGLGTGTAWVYSFSASLVPPEHAGQKIARLRGTIDALVQTRSQSLTIDDVMAAKNAARNRAGHRIVLKEVRQAGTNYIVSASLSRPADAAAGPLREVALQAGLRLEDAEGRALARRSYGSSSAADTVDVNVTFGRDDFAAGEQVGEPARLVWEVPTEVREVPVRFEFRDLPLP